MICHTIVPSNTPLHRTVLRLEEVSLAVDFEYEKTTDVHQAMAKLTDFEQKVVTAIVHGNESLESLSLEAGVPKTSLWRTWLAAKAKLQGYLHEYAQKACPKQANDKFCQSLDSAPSA